MVISKYFIEFIVYSFLGWIWECFYCTFKEHKWQNRGFLYGPICPIYGSGAVFASVLFTHVPALNPDHLKLWQIFLICALGSAILEYLTSYFLELKFHARWWDYSDMPLNVNGRICLPATILFGLAGIAIVKILVPITTQIEAGVPVIIAEVVALILMAVSAGDTALTVASLTQFVEKLEAFEANFNDSMEARYQSIEATPDKVRAAQQELRDRVDAFRSNLSTRQKYAMRNVRRLTSKKGTDMLARLQEAQTKIISSFGLESAEEKRASLSPRDFGDEAEERASLSPRNSEDLKNAE